MLFQRTQKVHKISSKRSNINKNVFLGKYENNNNAKEEKKTFTAQEIGPKNILKKSIHPMFI